MIVVKEGFTLNVTDIFGKVCTKNLVFNLFDRRWYHKLVFFYKIAKGLTPSYLQSYLLPDNDRAHNTWSSLRNRIKTSATMTLTFFPYCTVKWNQLNDDIRKIESIKKNSKMLIKVIRNKENCFQSF